MQLNYGQVRGHSAAVAAAIADARSARNLASRRRGEDAREEREAERHRRRRKRKSDRELDELLRRRVRVRVPREERPRIGTSTARKLYHRAVDMLIGTTGLSDSRGPDGLYSIHYSFVARGFASASGRRWRQGEAERAARYIVRADGLESGECGWWSSIAADRNELVAFYRVSEALEQHDRSNANVYITEIIALPFELSARQRRKAVRRICRFFDKRELPYTAAIHRPDVAGDQRNHHVHIMYSLRPCERHGPYDWSFDVTKEADINTADGIRARRLAVVKAINSTLCAAGSAKRYTHLSNKARGMAAGQTKIGQEATWAARRLDALEKRAARLQQLAAILGRLRGVLGQAMPKLQRQRALVAERLRNSHYMIEAAAVDSKAALLEAVVRQRLSASARSILQESSSRPQAIESAQGGVTSKLEAMTSLLVNSDRAYRIRAIGAEASNAMRDVELRLISVSASRLRRLARVRMVLDEALGLRTSMLWEALARRQARVDAIQSRAGRDARLEKLSSDLNQVFIARLRRLQALRVVTRDRLHELVDRVQSGLTETADKRAQMVSLVAMRKARENRARLLEQGTAIHQALVASSGSLADAGEAAASMMQATCKAIVSQTATGLVRLARLGGAAKRLEAIGRLDALSTRLDDVTSSATLRMLDADRTTRVRLRTIRPDALATVATARRLVLLGNVAEARHVGRRPAVLAEISEQTTKAAERRGSDRRKAIAAAAWQLRRSSFPPQIRTAMGFAILPPVTGSYRDVDCFEAEDVIQKCHARKRAEMLAAVRRKVEGAERSPFIERDGSARLPLDTFDQPLRRAVELAINDADLVHTIDQLLMFWREREAGARKTQARKAREAVERRDRMRPGVQRVFDAIRKRIEDGRYPKPAIAAIRDDILVVAQAIGTGELAMRSGQGVRHFYCASEGLCTIIATLAGPTIGRQILVALGTVTLAEPFGPAELPITLALPHTGRQRNAAGADMDGADITAITGKGGMER